MKSQLEVNPLCPVLLQFTRNPVCPLVGERIPNLPGAMLGHYPGIPWQKGLLRVGRGSQLAREKCGEVGHMGTPFYMGRKLKTEAIRVSSSLTKEVRS